MSQNMASIWEDCAAPLYSEKSPNVHLNIGVFPQMILMDILWGIRDMIQLKLIGFLKRRSCKKCMKNGITCLTRRSKDMKLKKLLKEISFQQFKGSKDVEITGICSNSKLIAPGNLFVAKKGRQGDGAHYIPEAIAAGAVAVL